MAHESRGLVPRTGGRSGNCLNGSRRLVVREPSLEGASSLEDWPDSIITLRSNDGSPQRTFAVRGRDVAVDPITIDMCPESRAGNA